MGIEIGGTKLQVGLGRGDGLLIGLVRMNAEPSRGAKGILDQIVEAVERLQQQSGGFPPEMAAIGIGFGGPVDLDRGVVVVSNQVAGWAGYPLAEWTREKFGVERVALQNDAATAALGEARYGAGIGHNPVLYVTIGSGIGGGLVVDGAIYRGAGRGSIEIGHLIVSSPEEPATDGGGDSWKTLESMASGWSIAREGQRLVESNQDDLSAGAATPLIRLCDGRISQVTCEMMAQASVEGDPGANRILRNARTALAQALAHAITLLAPRRIILGGGVTRIGEENWFEPIRLEVDRRVFAPFQGSYDIVPAGLGEEVVVHGAVALAFDAHQLHKSH